jgi:hypothetical protein
MCKKSCLLVSFVLLLIAASISSAATINWSTSPADSNWNNTANWDGGVIPNTTADYAKILMAAGPVFSSDRTATAYRVYLDGTNGSMTMDGGSLTVNNWLCIGYTAASDSGTLTVNSGTIATTSHLYCGVKGPATLNMSGGAINAGGTFYVARDSGCVADVNLSGGTITCNALNMNLNDQTNGLGRINITSTGTLIINGDVSATIAPWITKGWIKAYNGTGTVVVSTTTNPGKTTVTASAPTKAANPSPANNATNVSTLAELSWTGIAEANSHDVYFGTVSPGTFQTNTAATTFNPGMMTPSTKYYWRIDEVNGVTIATGDVWSFTTGSNIATNPNPANGAVSVSVTGTLSWTAGVTAASHDVYFGTSNPPASIGNQGGTTYNPGTLAISTTYYWRIDEVKDSNVYTGTVWNFTTEGSFRKGPYLIYPGDNAQMTVLWQLPSTQGCTLAWGTDTSYSTGSTATTEYGTDYQHKYTITDLTPGTKYYYRVTAGSSVATGSFRSAPAADANSVKFLAYGDTRTNAASHALVASAVNSTYAGEPDYQTVLLHTGDFVDSDDEAHWTSEYFNRSYTAVSQMQASMPIMGCLGNHETMGSGVTVFDKYWPYTYAGGHYYSFDYGPVHIAVVDQETAAYGAGSAQLAWLANDLANSTKPWKIIVLHQPGWCAGGTHGNNATVQTVIQPLCEQYGVQIVFAGHNHYYSRAVVNGVHHVTTGAGGAPFYPATGNQPNVETYTTNALEFCKVSIDGNLLLCQAVKPDGTLIDSFYVDKEEPDFTFVQATDPQIGWAANGNNDAKWPETVSKVNLLGPNFLIVTGDLVDNRGNPEQVALYKSGAAGLNPSIQLYNLPGNHDIGDTPDMTTYALWKSRFGYPPDNNNPWYSFTRSNNLFIVLDSLVLKSQGGFTYPDPNKAVEEMNWLTATLVDANTAGYNNIMVFMHTPLAMSSITEPDGTNNMPLGTGNGPRKQLLDLFHEYGVKAVFSGHAHYNSKFFDDDLEIITTSSCNSSLGTPSTPQGFRIVEVYPGHISNVYRPLPSIALLPCDFNGDGICDEKDLDVFVDHWLDNGMWP